MAWTAVMLVLERILHPLWTPSTACSHVPRKRSFGLDVLGVLLIIVLFSDPILGGKGCPRRSAWTENVGAAGKNGRNWWLPKNQLKKWQLLLSPSVCACQSALSRSLNRFPLGERGNREWSQKWGPRRLDAVSMANERPNLDSLQQLTWKLVARTLYQEKTSRRRAGGYCGSWLNHVVVTRAKCGGKKTSTLLMKQECENRCSTTIQEPFPFLLLFCASWLPPCLPSSSWRQAL